jgi:hypothetical protein
MRTNMNPNRVKDAPAASFASPPQSFTFGRLGPVTPASDVQVVAATANKSALLDTMFQTYTGRVASMINQAHEANQKCVIERFEQIDKAIALNSEQLSVGLEQIVRIAIKEELTSLAKRHQAKAKSEVKSEVSLKLPVKTEESNKEVESSVPMANVPKSNEIRLDDEDEDDANERPLMFELQIFGNKGMAEYSPINEYSYCSRSLYTMLMLKHVRPVPYVKYFKKRLDSKQSANFKSIDVLRTEITVSGRTIDAVFLHNVKDPPSTTSLGRQELNELGIICNSKRRNFCFEHEPNKWFKFESDESSNFRMIF